jgi:hypothetical protein
MEGHKKRNRILTINLKGRDNLGDISVDGK